MARILSSRPVTDAIADNLAPRVERLRILGIEPTLALVRVGARPDDVSYERAAILRAQNLGVATRVFDLPETVSQEKLLLQLRRINGDHRVHGCLLFRPLPAGMEEKLVCDELSVAKDVDGISTASLGAVFTDSSEGFAPCTAEACVRALDYYDIPVEGKHVVVVGRSLVVGKPLAMLLLRRNASVTICHSRTADLATIMRTADIVVCATGRARSYDAGFFKAGQVVLDVGVNFDAEGALCGDVDYDSVEPLVDAITPVPGGLGSITTSITMEHTIIAAEKTIR